MQIEMYNPDKLNLNEFFKIYDIDLVLNNELINNLEFELYNYETIFNNLLEDVTADPEDYLNIEEIDPEDLEDAIYDYCTENAGTGEIYQYFIVSGYDVERYLLKYLPTYEIFYNNENDLYLLGVGHWGMSWSFFFTEAPRPEHMRIKKYDEILGAGTSEV